ncbi:MAG: biopolymer transporter ExbD [Burkholderiales bacterium]
MSMTFASNSEEDEVVSTINTTPLVDVMLVLLIIFLITIPVVVNLVKLQLPKETNVLRESKPENVNIAVNKDGIIFWNELPMKTTNELLERLKKVSVKKPQPEVHIRGDLESNYEGIGRVIVTVQRAGIVKIGFITEPPPRN